MDPHQLTAALTAAFQTLDISRPQLPSFDPSTDDVHEWLLKFNAATHNKSGTDKINSLPLVLQKSALQWYIIRKQSVTATTTWAQIESDIKAQFAKNITAIIQELHLRVQRASESAADYCPDVIRLCNLYNPAMLEVEKVAHLMRGLSATLREKIILMQPKTSSEFMNNIATIESSSSALSHDSNIDPYKIIETLTTALVSKNVTSSAQQEPTSPQFYQQPAPDVISDIQRQLSSLQRKLNSIESRSVSNQRSAYNQRSLNNQGSVYDQRAFREQRRSNNRDGRFVSPQRYAQNYQTDVRCHTCGRYGHIRRNCPQNVPRDSSRSRSSSTFPEN